MELLSLCTECPLTSWAFATLYQGKEKNCLMLYNIPSTTILIDFNQPPKLNEGTRWQETIKPRLWIINITANSCGKVLLGRGHLLNWLFNKVSCHICGRVTQPRLTCPLSISCRTLYWWFSTIFEWMPSCFMLKPFPAPYWPHSRGHKTIFWVGQTVNQF